MQPIDLAKSHAAGGRIPQAKYKWVFVIAACVVILGIVAVWTSRTSSWLNNPVGLDARIKRVDELQLQDATDPKLVILGSSRSAFGINSYDLGRSLGFNPAEVRNISFPGFGDEQLVAQVKMKGEKLAKAEIWIIGVDDYFFLKKKPAPGAHSATFQDAESWLVSIAPVVVRINQMGRELHRNFSELVGWERQRSIDGWTVDDRGSWSEPQLEKRIVDPANESKVFESILHSYFRDSESLDRKAVDEFAKLIDYGIEHGVQVTLISMPYHPAYDSLGEDLYGENFKSAVSRVRDIANQRAIKFVNCRESLTNCDVGEKDFADPVHLNAQGSRHFTNYLAAQIGR